MQRGFRQLIGYLAGAVLVLGLIPCALVFGGGYLDDLLWGKFQLGPWVLYPVVLLLFGVGAWFGFRSVILQNVEGNGGPVQIGKVDISPRTTRLVVSGPYRYTRNPMLLGAFLMYLALSVYLQSPGAILCTLAFLAFMLAVIVPSEEKRLLADFGADYQAYRAQVPRFIPRVRPRRMP